MSNLPEPVERHFRLKVKQRLDNVMEFCTDALLIPVGHVNRIEKVVDVDSYWVYVKSGYRFMVSAPEIAQWDARESLICERGDFIDEGGRTGQWESDAT